MPLPGVDAAINDEVGEGENDRGLGSSGTPETNHEYRPTTTSDCEM